MASTIPELLDEIWRLEARDESRWTTAAWFGAINAGGAPRNSVGP